MSLLSSTETRLASTRAASSGWGERRGGGEKMEKMVVRGEMRGVVVGRSPGQSPGFFALRGEIRASRRDHDVTRATHVRTRFPQKYSFSKPSTTRHSVK